MSQTAQDPRPPSDAARWKRLAGEAAAALVEDGMIVGLGTGSTARWATAEIGRRIRDEGLRGIVAIASSQATTAEATDAGVPLSSLLEHPNLDLTIDGTDEISPTLGLIKGGGGALVREKIIASRSTRFVVVADEGKLVGRLGTTFALPVAVVPFGWPVVRAMLEARGAAVTLRGGDAGGPKITDDGLYVLDARFPEGIPDPESLNTMLDALPAVVTSGLFLRLTHAAIVAGADGVRVIDAP